jgi:gamma-glutamyltranspeptidase/glutathione hydrolase/leukotriene-C4 hydrolase
MRRPLPAGRRDASINGGLAVAVPLELQGMWLAHRRHGKLPWARLLQVCV